MYLTDGLYRELLSRAISIASSLPEGKGQLARANFALATLLEEQGRTVESQNSKDIALKLRNELKPELETAPFEGEEFNKLCLWMLW